jgi:hypothetical protein
MSKQTRKSTKIIVSAEELMAIHDQLLMTHQTGENIISVANSIMTLRRLIETSPKADAAEASNDDAEEVNDAADEEH